MPRSKSARSARTIGASLPEGLRDVPESLARRLEGDRADGTLYNYTRSFDRYIKWRGGHDGGDPLDGDCVKVALYLNHLADIGKTWSYISGTAAAIRHTYVARGKPLDDQQGVLRRTLQGILRDVGGRARNPSRPLSPHEIKELVRLRSERSEARDKRDAAVILVGYFGAMRRSEIANLKIGDVEFHDLGVMLQIRRSKADQEGRGATIRLVAGDDPDVCPVTALKDWLDVRLNHCEGFIDHTKKSLFCGIHRSGRFLDGPINARTIERLLARVVNDTLPDDLAKSDFEKLGTPPSRITPHSMRSGMATSAAEAGAPLDAIMRHLRHGSPQSTIKYVRPVDDWKNNLSGLVQEKLKPKP